MNLGDRINCGRLTPSHIGLPDKRVQGILTDSIDAKAIRVDGSPLAYGDLANLPTVDTTVTADSINLVTSGAVESAIAAVTSSTGNLYAPVASPSFTGTVTAPVINATTISLNGVDVATSMAANTAKVGITPSQAAAIVANTAKVGITQSQADAVVANTAKVGISQAQADAIVTNNAKVGITQSQADAIVANTAKVGITSNQAGAIVANTAKVGITPSQADAIVANTAKVGITPSQADAIVANTAKVSYPGPPSWSQVSSKPDLQEALTISNTASSTFNGSAYVFGGLDLTGGTLTYIPQAVAGIYAPLSGPTFTGTVAVGAIPNLEAAVSANTAKAGITTAQANAISTNSTKLSCPTWVPAANPNYAPIASPSFTGNVSVAGNLTVNGLSINRHLEDGSYTTRLVEDVFTDSSLLQSSSYVTMKSFTITGMGGGWNAISCFIDYAAMGTGFGQPVGTGHAAGTISVVVGGNPSPLFYKSSFTEREFHDHSSTAHLEFSWSDPTRNGSTWSGALRVRNTNSSAGCRVSCKITMMTTSGHLLVA